jgi:hypothetical protein
MNPTELANKLAMDAADNICYQTKCSDVNHRFLKRTILSTIPLVELLECVEALRESAKGCMHPPDFYCPFHQVLNALDSKLAGNESGNEKGQQ